jgi:hypothetical protein
MMFRLRCSSIYKWNEEISREIIASESWRSVEKYDERLEFGESWRQKFNQGFYVTSMQGWKNLVYQKIRELDDKNDE